MYLYPRLPLGVASSLAREWQQQDIISLREQGGIEHKSVIWTPVGGTRIQAAQLDRLRSLLQATSARLGWPEPLKSRMARNQFDSLVSIVLYNNMDITPGEASREDVWSFISCVMMPELVRWRFPGKDNKTDLRRFVGGVRNTYQRLWWRSYVLYKEDNEKPYSLVKELGEDELVQIMERPNISGNRKLSQKLAYAFLKNVGSGSEGSRMMFMREAAKKLTRISSIIALDTLNSDELDHIVMDVFTHIQEVANHKKS